MIKKFFFWIPVAALALGAVGCQTEETAPESNVDPRGDEYTVSAPAEISDSRAEELTASHQQFAADFVGQVAQPGENTVVSPLSMYNFMAMMANGADGKTLEQIVNLLGAKDAEEVVALCRRQLDSFAAIDATYQKVKLPNLDGEGYEYMTEEEKAELLRGLKSAFTQTKLANAIWVDSNVGVPYQSYMDECRQWLDAEAKSLDFGELSAPSMINQWVTEKTNGLIPVIFPEGAPIFTEVVCTNALYLNIKWSGAFDKAEEKMTFTNIDGSIAKPATLTKLANYKYIETDDAHFVDIPLGTLAEEMTYTIILPKSEGVDATEVLSLATQNVNSLTQKALIDLTMPEFKVETSLWGLRPTLAEMGMADAFDKEKANFKRMGSFKFNIYDVVHRASINVCESGIEAAAGTGNYTVSSPYPGQKPPEPKVITVDHPFVFRITDNATGMILFLGTVNCL